jgi:predicted component of type VI protein secretion system
VTPLADILQLLRSTSARGFASRHPDHDLVLTEPFERDREYTAISPIHPGAQVQFIPRTVGVPVPVGRDSRAQVMLDHPAVSRLHIVLAFTQAGWKAMDRSSNGTWLNEERLPKDQAIQLGFGVAIRMGRALMLRLFTLEEFYRYAGQTATPPAQPRPAAGPAPADTDRCADTWRIPAQYAQAAQAAQGNPYVGANPFAEVKPDPNPYAGANPYAEAKPDPNPYAGANPYAEAKPDPNPYAGANPFGEATLEIDFQFDGPPPSTAANPTVRMRRDTLRGKPKPGAAPEGNPPQAPRPPKKVSDGDIEYEFEFDIEPDGRGGH